MRDKVLNILQRQALHRSVDERFYIWPQASRQLLRSLSLERLLDLGKAPFNAVKVGAGWQVEDVVDAHFVEPVEHGLAAVHCQVIPEEARRPFACVLAQDLDVVEPLGHIDRFFVGLPSNNSSIGGDGEHKSVSRLVQRAQVQLQVGPAVRPLRWLHGPAREHAFIRVEDLLARCLGRHHFAIELLLELSKSLLHLWSAKLRPFDHLFLDAFQRVDLPQQCWIHLLVWVLVEEGLAAVVEGVAHLRLERLLGSEPRQRLLAKEPDAKSLSWPA